jgi:Flp pilus assembly pilin Flp
MGIRRHELETHIAENVPWLACDCSGATSIEHANLTFIAVAIILVVNQVGGSLNSLYQSVQTALSAL